jgi:hypothetical protein
MAAGTDAPANRSSTLTMDGVVLMPDGSRAANAVVSLLEFRGRTPTTLRTDAQGRFRLTGDFCDDCRLFVHSADARNQLAYRLSASDARERLTKPVELKLAPAREHVVSVSSEGKPVAGVHVAAAGFSFHMNGVTGQDGKATLHILDDEKLVEVVAWHPKLGAAGRRDLTQGLAGTQSQLSLLEPAAFKVRVIDQNGQAVGDVELAASVNVEGMDYIMTEDVQAAHFHTNAAGEATIPWFPREKVQSWDIEMIDANWKVDRVEQGNVSERMTTVHVRRKMPVQGRLVMPEGKSAEGILVSGSGFGPGNMSDIPNTRARRDGSFTLVVVSDHGYVLDIADSAWASSGWTGVIVASDWARPAAIELPVYPATPLEVRVVRGPLPTPVVNSLVSVRTAHDFTWQDAQGRKRSAAAGSDRLLRTDSNGVARTGVGKGSLKVRVLSGSWHEERELTIEGNERVSIEFHRVVGDPQSCGPPGAGRLAVRTFGKSNRSRVVHRNLVASHRRARAGSRRWYFQRCDRCGRTECAGYRC